MDLIFTLCQINSNIAKDKYQIIQNKQRIIEIYKNSKSMLCIFPELVLCGYIPKDLLFYENYIQEIQKSNNEIVLQTDNKLIFLPTIIKEDNNLYNAIIIAQNQKIVDICYKTLLPNNSIFNESRYFKTKDKIKNTVIEVNSIKCGVLICEDIWYYNQLNQDKCPVQNILKENIDILFVSNASPYDVSKINKRMDILKQISSANVSVVYCNNVGGYDGIIFDGHSILIKGSKRILAGSYPDLMQKNLPEKNLSEEDLCKESFETIKLPMCQEVITDFVFNKETQCFNGDNFLQPHQDATNKLSEIYDILKFGLQNFMSSVKFDKVIIGLSGGADSALVLKIASDVLKHENIFCYGLRTQYTSQESIDDAVNLVKNISDKINFEIIDIEEMYQTFVKHLNLRGLNLQNIQARTRANILMAKSTELNALLLTTGNKSEIACGYCTIYGDMCGGYNPIKDLYKTQIFELMKFINNDHKAIFPVNILQKPPSAELAFNQKDSDNLPSYQILDLILFLHIEMQMSFSDIIDLRFNNNDVSKILALISKYSFELEKYIIENNKNIQTDTNIFLQDDVKLVEKLLNRSQYKRRQSPPGTKISIKSFETSDWQFHI